MSVILLRPQCVKGCNDYTHASMGTINTVSMVDADGMVPLWYQVFSNHEHNTVGLMHLIVVYLPRSILPEYTSWDIIVQSA